MTRRSRFKFAAGDRVRCRNVPGRWVVHAPHPERGRYWLRPRPDDQEACALASVMVYGMISEHVSRLEDDLG